MKLYKTNNGAVIEDRGEFSRLPQTDWDILLNRTDLDLVLTSLTRRAVRLRDFSPLHDSLAPIGGQEVWAAGVTYQRSMIARMEESNTSGGGVFYDRVYSAPRPELFFKATPHRVSGNGDKVRIRKDSIWNVPEPELALVVNSAGSILGYTIGNDMSSRDIEGENPLYLPQAKIYSNSCALGPCIVVRDRPLPDSTEIEMEVIREGVKEFHGSTQLSNMKRTPRELVDYLFRDNSFPCGCFLLTGTGIVPPDDFTLNPGDEIRIRIEHIGELINFVQLG